MPDLTIEGAQTITVAAGTRLLNALIDHNVDMLYRCGGHGRCGLCQVAFSAGEPAEVTLAEERKRAQLNLLGGVRLACQIAITQDMSVRSLLTWAGSGLPDPGRRHAAHSAGGQRSPGQLSVADTAHKRWSG